MQNETPPGTAPRCPSAPPHLEGSTILGVVGGTPEQPRLAYLAEPRPVMEKVLGLSGPALPTTIFRFGAPCAGHGCRHFDGTDCRLASRVVQLLPPVVDGLPPCHLRPDCRWWQQEGKVACLHCPQVVTDSLNPSELLRQIADPKISPGERLVNSRIIPGVLQSVRSAPTELPHDRRAGSSR